ncbi:MAG: hypothetical protein FWG46_03935 [Treponema sp.]|nr:hypothetical protein [Treponema sp.]
MKYLFFVAGLLLPVVVIPAQEKPAFTWDLLVSGSWEESKNLHNRLDARVFLVGQDLVVRGQAIDRRPLNFQLDRPLGDNANEEGIASFGLYHKATGSRLLFGTLDEWGLPARIRSPWIRSAPYAENHKPVMADLKTAASSTKSPEAYLYLSSPLLEFERISLRGFASAQFPAQGEFEPAFSFGLDTRLDGKYDLLLEGFYTGAQLPAKEGSSWFSDPPPLPDRDFRLLAGALGFNMPYLSLSSDWAWSETFAYGSGVYGCLGIRFNPPRSWGWGEKPSPWSLSLATDGMTDRYVGRDGTSPAGGLRTAGKIEWKGPRSSLFRASTSLRSGGLEEPFSRSSTGLYYRFPALSGRAADGAFPLRLSRISLGADRNASDRNTISDSVDGSLGLSLGLPPLLLPAMFLPGAAAKNPKPKSYPLGITLSTSIKSLGATAEIPSPYPFAPTNQEFDSAKTSCELIWSPGIFQFRTRWGITAFARKDTMADASFSAAVRFKRGRISAKIAYPDFPDKWNCTLSWRVEK